MKSPVAFIIVLFLSFNLFSQPSAEESKPVSLAKVIRQPVTVPKFSTSPVIDGKVDDEIWKSAAVLKDLIQTNPGDNIPASKPTEVYIGYDEKNFYIAFKCWDEKDKIRASVAQRDGVFSEDNVRFWLDTYDDKRRAYVIGMNPLGIQADGIFTEGQGADFNVDILFESKGVIEDWGWSVEAKIPFKSLRYTAGKGKSWGFNAARNIDRLNDEFDSWVPQPRNVPGFLTHFGKITGLDDIKTERTLEIIPTLTLKETGRRVSQTKFSNPPIEPDFGFTAKFQISPNVTLDAAYNPDFADTEADAPVVEANQRFPIFFSEKRPFFLEGIDIFRSRIQAVYTRRIENPELAVKLSGKIGKNTFGILGAIDEPLANNPNRTKALAGIVRFKRDFGKESNIGFLATHYSYPNKYNTVAGFDYRWKINKNSEFRGQVLGSTSKTFFYNPNIDAAENRIGNAVAYDYNYYNVKGNFTYGFGGRGASRNYRADLGFTQRTNTNQIYTFLEYSSTPKPQAFIISKGINASYGYRHDFSGRFQSSGAEFNYNMSLKGNAFARFGGYLNRERLVEDEFGAKRNTPERPTQKGAFFGAPNRDATQAGMSFNLYKKINKRIDVEANMSYDFNTFDLDFGAGRRFPRVSPAYLANKNNPLFDQIDPGIGNQINYSFGASFKPKDNFNFSLNYSKTKLTRNDTDLVAFDSNIFQFLSTYQFSRFISVKARIDYNTLNSRVFGQYTFAWTPSPGKALYVGYNDNYNYKGFAFGQQQTGFLQLNRTFFIKMSYLFRKSF